MNTAKNETNVNVIKESTPAVVEIPAATGAVPETKPEKKPLKGRPLKLPGQGIMPKDTGQLFVKAEGGDLVVYGVVLPEGAVVERFMAGSTTLDMTAGDVFPEGGVPVKTGTYVIVLVRNTTDGALACEGSLMVEGGAPAAKPAAAGGAMTAPARAIPKPAAPAVSSAGPSIADAVIPGKNEVAILMRRGDAIRVHEILSARDQKKQTLTDHERPSLVRPFEDALKRGQ